jgi:hypothetical protein
VIVGAVLLGVPDYLVLAGRVIHAAVEILYLYRVYFSHESLAPARFVSEVVPGAIKVNPDAGGKTDVPIECRWVEDKLATPRRWRSSSKGSHMGIMRTKSIDQSIRDTEEPEFELRKALGPIDLVVFGIGVIIGTGIFVLTGDRGGKLRGASHLSLVRLLGDRLRACGTLLR